MKQCHQDWGKILSGLTFLYTSTATTTTSEGKPAVMSDKGAKSLVHVGSSQMHQPRERVAGETSQRGTCCLQRGHSNAQLRGAAAVSLVLWCPRTTWKRWRHIYFSMQSTPNEAKKHHCVSMQMSTKLRYTISSHAISVLSPWSRVAVVSSHPSIFPPTLICLEQLKFHKTPTTCQIMPRFHSLSLSCALTTCQAYLQALEYKEKNGSVTLQRQGKNSSTSNEMNRKFCWNETICAKCPANNGYPI